MRLAGIILMATALAATVSVLMAVAASPLPAPIAAQAAGNPLRVAVYVSTGANSDKIASTLRACQAAGFAFYGIGRSDIKQGRLTTDNFDVLLLPAGESDNKTAYASTDGLDQTLTKNNIKAFVNAGGGVVALESAAYYVSLNGGTLDLYKGNYTRTGAAGKNTITITDSTFGSGTQELYRTAGGGYFALPSGATQVATDSANRTVIARATYGSGRVVVCSLDPELRGDSELDWSIWDNWAMNNTQTNSVGGWKLLGRMINWAGTGTATEPTITTYANPTGSRVAIVSTNTADGGAWPGLLPGINRAVEYSGDIPLAIRFDDINSGRLTLDNFKAVILPGGYSYGYKTGLGATGGTAIKNFATSGGGVMGICAGSYYLSNTVVWESKSYDYLGLFGGTDTGPLDGLLYPSYTLTTTTINDPVIGNLGTQTQMYYGGGYKTNLAASNATMVASYNASGYEGYANAIRFMYGSGHVLLIGTHPESRSGSNEDWMYWDNWENDSTTPLVNPDNPWTFFRAVLNNWLTL
jgi:glutamine amidotransferase-like uncharacterized protein